MIFSQEGYTISFNGEKIQLLRKEYQLLSFLYKNRGRAFTRQELLDAVWDMETPTDRTVDDHIYRLRKKLSPISHVVTIKTVKGYGYLLEMKNEKEEPLPEELVKHTEQLMTLYYQYGYGNLLKSFLTNKQLGLSKMEKHKMVLSLLNSDFKALYVQASYRNHTFLLLFLYVFIEDDVRKAIHLCYKVLDNVTLDELNEMDIKFVILPILYLKVDEAKKAMKIVRKGLIKTNHAESHRFYPLLKLLDTIILFYCNEMEIAKDALLEVEDVLNRLPYRREQAVFQIVKGCIELAEGKDNQGFARIEEGCTIIQRTGHTYYFLLIYSILGILLPIASENEKIIQFYNNEKQLYYKNSGLFEIKEKISAQMALI